MVPPLFLNSGIVGPAVQVAVPHIGRRIRLRSRLGLASESEFVNVPRAAVGAWEQERHRHLALVRKLLALILFIEAGLDFGAQLVLEALQFFSRLVSID